MHLPTPYWRLSAYYLVYFAILGSFIPYWGLYLASIGVNTTDIGWLISIFSSARIVAPWFFGSAADISGKSALIIKLASLLVIISFISLYLVNDFWLLSICLFSLGFLLSGLIPQFDSLTLEFLKNNIQQYSRIRLWGSIGFIISVSYIGWWLSKYSIANLPFIIGFLMLVSFLISLTINHDSGAGYTATKLNIITILKNTKIKYFLLVTLLLQASHGSYYVYFSIFLQEHGYGNSQIGYLWATGVIAEVILFLFLNKLSLKISDHTLIAIALMLTTARWLATSIFVDYWYAILLIQILHAASFGLFHAISMRYLENFFTDNQRSRGQAIYAIAGFGIGAVLGSVIASLNWNTLGGEINFTISATMSLIASIIWHKTKSLY